MSKRKALFTLADVGHYYLSVDGTLWTLETVRLEPEISMCDVRTSDKRTGSPADFEGFVRLIPEKKRERKKPVQQVSIPEVKSKRHRRTKAKTLADIEKGKAQAKELEVEMQASRHQEDTPRLELAHHEDGTCTASLGKASITAPTQREAVRGLLNKLTELGEYELSSEDHELVDSILKE